MRRSLLLALTLARCAADDVTAGDDSTGPAPPDAGVPARGPGIVFSTPVTTPGASVFVQTDEPLDDLELRAGDLPLPAGALVYAGKQDDRYAALFALPDGLAPGDTELVAIRRADGVRGEPAALAVVAPTFVDVARATGLHQVHDITGSPTKCAWSHTGLAWGDLEGDGDLDFYAGNVGAAGRLMRNDGDADGDGLPDFVEITAEAGLADVDQVAMATFVDHDGDGDRDLFVGRRGRNALLRSRLADAGELVFDDVAPALGLADEAQRTMGAAWGDYDRDGDLDLYVVNHAWCFPTRGSDLDAQDHLYRNDGEVFTDVTAQLGVAPTSPVHSLGFSAAWLDHDRDGDLDLVVINDHIAGLGGPNALWRSDGPGAAPGEWRFTSAGAESGLAIPVGPDGQGVNGMGLAFGDVNYDGHPDLAFTNIGANYLLLSRGDGTWRDASVERKVRRGILPWKQTSITWAAHLLDVDNDADLDLYFAGGDIHAHAPIPDAFLRNDGASFSDATWAVGLSHLDHAKGSALADLDRDGGLDFATAHWGSDLRVHHNRHPARGHWLVVDLVGAGRNRDALGSVVTVESPGNPPQTCFRSGAPALGAGGELACHFGLGAATRVDRVTVTWPDGGVTTPPPPAVDLRVTYTQ